MTSPPQTTQQSSPPQTIQHSGGGAGAAVAILLALLVVGGMFLFFTQQHGAGTNPLQCFPHQETVYVGYIQTATGTVQITQENRITQMHYDKGILLYTVYLTNDQGQQFEYHYVTGLNLAPTTVVTGC